jgi:hypothetical protein
MDVYKFLSVKSFHVVQAGNVHGCSLKSRIGIVRHFHEVSVGNVYECLLKSRIGEVRVFA